jgi:hypothetical protein
MRICIRVLALSAVLLSATMLAANAAQWPIAPAKTHAAASATVGPVVLRQLRASATEDVASDEPYLKVNGKKVWGAVNYLPARNGQPALNVQGATGSHGTYWFTYNVTFPKGQANRGG